MRCFIHCWRGRLSVILKIPRRPPSFSGCSLEARVFVSWFLPQLPAESYSDDGASSSVSVLCRGQRLQADDFARGRGICLDQLPPLGNTRQQGPPMSLLSVRRVPGPWLPSMRMKSTATPPDSVKHWPYIQRSAARAICPNRPAQDPAVLKNAWFVSGHRFRGVVTGPHLLPFRGCGRQRGFAANYLGARF